MSRIVRKRTPCRRRSKNTRSQRGGLTREEIFDSLYNDTLDVYHSTQSSNVYKKLLTLLIAREKLSPTIKEVVTSYNKNDVNTKEFANAIHLIQIGFNKNDVETTLYPFVVGLKPAFESRYEKEQNRMLDARISALKSDDAPINPRTTKDLKEMADLLALAKEAETKRQSSAASAAAAPAPSAAPPAPPAAPAPKYSSYLLLSDEELADIKFPPNYPRGGKTRRYKRRACKRTRRH